MVLSLVTALVLSHPIGPAVRHRIGPLSFELPASWRQTSRNKETVQFDAADGDAYLLIDFQKLEVEKTPEDCLEIIIQRLAAGPNWRIRTIDVYAVAHQVNYDRSPNLANTARVEQLVGCDGRQAWSMVFFIDVSAWTYYAQVTAHVTETLRRSKVKPGSREDKLLEDNVRELQESQ